MKSSTLFSALAVSLSIGQSNAASSYILDTVMWGSTFFNAFNFVTVDPNNGYVNYLTKTAAQAAGLISSAEGAAARISVDATTTLSGAAGTGRNSVRIESTKTWTHGLFVFNIAYMPAPACGIWPALWMLGPGVWPAGGEIDIIEGINLQSKNLMSLHTSNNCKVPKSTLLTGATWVGEDCYVGDTNNAGCGINGATTDTYGNGFNADGGGLMVVEWTSQFVKMWWYNNKAGIPADLANGKPVQTNRGTPQGYWLGGQGCTLDSKVTSQKIVINTDFCGSYAGNANIWASTTACSSKASSCNAYVAAHPKDYVNGKWLFNSIKVYTLQTTAKRGIEDPSLEFEALARNATLVNVDGEDHVKLPGELQDEVFMPQREDQIRVEKKHLHRHIHRSDRHI